MPVEEESHWDWLAISREWEESDLSQKAYCESKGISWRVFNQSRTKLMAKGLVKPRYKHSKVKLLEERMEFIPVSLPDILSEAPKSGAKDWIEIQLPYGIVLRIPAC
jgi:hypothetical protein